MHGRGTFLKAGAMRTVVLAAALVATSGVVACDRGDDAALRALATRLDALEATVRDADASRPAPPQPDSRLDRLDADVRSLEGRLAELEAEVALLHEAPATGATAGDTVDDRRERRHERRDRMRDLTAAYRDKLAEVRAQYRDDPGSPDRQRALRDIVEWYRAERRALMRAP